MNPIETEAKIRALEVAGVKFHGPGVPTATSAGQAHGEGVSKTPLNLELDRLINRVVETTARIAFGGDMDEAQNAEVWLRAYLAARDARLLALAEKWDSDATILIGSSATSCQYYSVKLSSCARELREALR